MNPFDDYLLHLLYGGKASPWLVDFMRTLTIVGEGWITLAFVPVLVWKRPRHITAHLIATLLATGALVWTLKQLIRRLRPYQAVDWVHALVTNPPTDFSCPSGHSAGSFAMAVFVLGVVARGRGRTTRAVALASSLVVLALGVAVSRVFLGVHYPSDIVVGSMLGSTVGYLGGSRYLTSLQRRLDAAEEVAPAQTDAEGSKKAETA